MLLYWLYMRCYNNTTTCMTTTCMTTTCMTIISNVKLRHIYSYKIHEIWKAECASHHPQRVLMSRNTHFLVYIAHCYTINLQPLLVSAKNSYNFVRTCCLRPDSDWRLRPIWEGRMHSLACLPSIIPVRGFKYSFPMRLWFHKMISSIIGVGMLTMAAMSLNVHKPKGRSVKKNYR